MKPQKDPLNKLQKPEDVLAYGLSEWLRQQKGDKSGALPTDWRNYVTPDGGYKNGAASLNHKGMAAASAVHMGNAQERQAGIKAWKNRFDRELRGGEFKGTEPLGKYEPWNVGAVILAWEDAAVREDCARYLRGTAGLLSLGAGSLAATNIVGRKSSLPFPGAMGCRHDPGHLEGDMKADILDRLVFPQHRDGRINVYKQRAYQREIARPWEKFQGEERELTRRKVMSETWVYEALDRTDFKLSLEDREACASWINSSDQTGLWHIAVNMLSGLSSEISFCWMRWANGFRASYISGGSNERNIWADAYDPSTQEGFYAFPYDLQNKSPRGGECRPQYDGGRFTGELRATSRGGQASVMVPTEEPMVGIVFGPGGAVIE
jgi:hypothetical protein